MKDHIELTELISFIKDEIKDTKRIRKIVRHLESCENCIYTIKSLNYIRDHFDLVWNNMLTIYEHRGSMGSKSVLNIAAGQQMLSNKKSIDPSELVASLKDKKNKLEASLNWLSESETLLEGLIDFKCGKDNVSDIKIDFPARLFSENYIKFREPLKKVAGSSTKPSSIEIEEPDIKELKIVITGTRMVRLISRKKYSSLFVHLICLDTGEIKSGTMKKVQGTDKYQLDFPIINIGEYLIILSLDK